MTLSGMTNAGLELLIKSQTGTIPEFTKIKIGDGAITDQNIAELDDLINVVDELNIKSYKTSKDTENNTATLQVFTVIAQGDFGFYFREMGLFAIDPDTNEEILYSYVNNGDEAKYIPQCGGNKVVEELASMVVAVSDTDNIIVHCDSELKIEEQIEGNGGYSLFDTVIKDHLLTYEESEGFALQGTYVYKDGIAGERWGYPDFIEQCISEKEEATATRMTLGSSTIIAHVHSNGHIYYNISDKSVVDTFYNTFGAAWFYGVDEENDRVFLPRNDYFFKSATSNPGNYNAPQLPSLAHSHILTITGGSHSHSVTLGSAGSHTHTRGTMDIKASWAVGSSSSASGAAHVSGTRKGEGGGGGGTDNNCVFTASDNWTGSTSSSGSHSHSVTVGSDSHTHSGSAASANPAGSLSGSTVLPPSVNGLLYIVVGNVRQKSAVVINAELTSAIAAMDNKKSLVLDDIDDAKDTAIGAITTAKTGVISDIEDAGAAQLELINSDLNTASEYADEAQRQAEIAEEYANIVVAGQQQTDFAQNDPNAIDFIKNKPDCDWQNIVYKEILQTLKNKSIDGSENTITNLPFSSLLSSMVLTEINRQNATNNTLATTAAIMAAIYNLPVANMNITSNLSNLNDISDELLPTSLAVYNAIQNALSASGLNFAGENGINIDTEFNTDVNVISSNENLTVTSSYTGTMGAVGTITYNFTYGEYDDNGSTAYGWLDDNGDVVDLTDYDLTVVGTPDADDVITLKYITTSTTTISADVEAIAGSVKYADLPDNPHYSFTNGLSSTQTRQTTVSIVSSNEDLTVTSSYTGTQANVGIIEYIFKYEDNSWVDADGNTVNLANYNLTVVGTPEEDDSITLTYTTIYNTVVSGQTLPTKLSDFTDDLGTNPAHSHSQYLTSHQDISGKEDIAKAMTTLATSGTVALADNSVNKITPSGTVNFSLPSVTNTTKFHQILVQLNLSTVVTINTGTSYYFNKTAPDLSNAGVYNLIYEYDNANGYWVCGAITKGAAS